MHGGPMYTYTVTIPRLETHRFLLREYREADFDDFAAFYAT